MIIPEENYPHRTNLERNSLCGKGAHEETLQNREINIVHVTLSVRNRLRSEHFLVLKKKGLTDNDISVYDFLRICKNI